MSHNFPLKRSLPFIVAIVSVVWISARATEKTAVVLILLGLTILAGIIAFVLPRASDKRFRIFDSGLIVVCLMAIVTVFYTHWPLRLTYRLSRQAFDNAAKEIEAGHPFNESRRIGFFTIKKGELNYHGVVCLWTDLNPAGHTGFARCSPESVNGKINLWSWIELDDDWQFVSED